MLRHLGEKRSFSHNLRLAVLLCLNAGFVNAAGFIAFAVLTTNVTGHAALLAVNLAKLDLRAARVVTLWLILFLCGAFASSWYIGKMGRNRPFAYTVPILLISIIMLVVALSGAGYNHSLSETEYLAGSLLLAMGCKMRSFRSYPALSFVPRTLPVCLLIWASTCLLLYCRGKI